MDRPSTEALSTQELMRSVESGSCLTVPEAVELLSMTTSAQSYLAVEGRDSDGLTLLLPLSPLSDEEIEVDKREKEALIRSFIEAGDLKARKSRVSRDEIVAVIDLEKVLSDRERFVPSWLKRRAEQLQKERLQETLRKREQTESLGITGSDSDELDKRLRGPFKRALEALGSVDHDEGNQPLNKFGEKISRHDGTIVTKAIIESGLATVNGRTFQERTVKSQVKKLFCPRAKDYHRYPYKFEVVFSGGRPRRESRTEIDRYRSELMNQPNSA